MADAQRLGKYRIIATLGSGGFATAYKARHTILDRDVALKVLHPALLVDRSFVERFFREARTVARLRHPGIVAIHDVDEVDGRAYIAMELASTNLAAYLADKGPLPWPEALALLRPICEALDYAHQHGVIHRDLKPANILLTEDGRPLISDFGFARLASQSSASLSVSGSILGTPGYIAPEVWDHNAAEAPADQYALACIAYELLTGDVLFKGATPIQAMRAHDRGPQFPATWPPGVPPGVTDVLAHALSREPEQRFHSAVEFWQALAQPTAEMAAGLTAPAAAPPDTLEAASPTATPVAPPPDTLGAASPTATPVAPPPDALEAASPTATPVAPPPDALEAASPTAAPASSVPGEPDAMPPVASGTSGARSAIRQWAPFAGVLLLLGAVGVFFALSERDGGGFFAQPEAPSETTAADVPLWKVGLVKSAGSIDDRGFNKLAYAGVEQAAGEFGFEYNYDTPEDEAAYEMSIRSMIEQGHNVIVTVGSPLTDVTVAAAAAHSDITFIGVDQYFEPGTVTDNLVGLQFREDQAGFLAGALAAMMTSSGTIGIVAGEEIPPVKRFRNGFEKGAQHVNPDITLLGEYLPTFTDAELGASTAEQMIGEGADVICGAGGSTGSGAIKAAAEQGVLVIGVDQDEYTTTFAYGSESGADRLLTSAVKHVNVAVYTAIKAVVEDTFEGNGVMVFDAANGGIGRAPFHDTEDLVSDDVKSRLDEIFQALADGSQDTGVDPVSGDLS